MSDHPTIPPQSGIMDIALYVGGQSTIAGHDDVLKLSSNENPLGCSPQASAAFQAAATNLSRYPSTDHAVLRQAIADTHGLNPDRIICGVGSDEVLQFVTHAFAGAGDEVLTTQHGFAMYPILAHMVGATPITVPEHDRMIDIDALLGAVTDGTRLVFLANPANPTGTMLPGDELRRLIAGLPATCLLVHDGAYMEFADADYSDAALVDEFPNVVMTRTFSKIHGLGGLRIGWGYAQRPIIDVLNRIRQPFNLSNAQIDTAAAAIRDVDFTRHCATENTRLRLWMRSQLVQMGVDCDESHANFLLARFGSTDAALACNTALRDAGIIVRHVANYDLPQALRITIGTEDDCRRVIAVIGDFMASERARG